MAEDLVGQSRWAHWRPCWLAPPVARQMNQRTKEATAHSVTTLAAKPALTARLAGPPRPMYHAPCPVREAARRHLVGRLVVVAAVEVAGLLLIKTRALLPPWHAVVGVVRCGAAQMCRLSSTALRAGRPRLNDRACHGELWPGLFRVISAFHVLCVQYAPIHTYAYVVHSLQLRGCYAEQGDRDYPHCVRAASSLAVAASGVALASLNPKRLVLARDVCPAVLSTSTHIRPHGRSCQCCLHACPVSWANRPTWSMCSCVASGGSPLIWDGLHNQPTATEAACSAVLASGASTACAHDAAQGQDSAVRWAACAVPRTAEAAVAGRSINTRARHLRSILATS